MFERKRKEKEKEPTKESEKKKKGKIITLDANDDCFVRAEKIIIMTGLCNADSGMIGAAARGVKAYMDLDKKMECRKSAKKPVKTKGGK